MDSPVCRGSLATAAVMIGSGITSYMSMVSELSDWCGVWTYGAVPAGDDNFDNTVITVVSGGAWVSGWSFCSDLSIFVSSVVVT